LWNIDKSRPWDFFDGVCQGTYRICGLGFLLCFSDSNYVTGRGHMGTGTNNCAEFQAHLELRHCAQNHNIGSFQVFWDSKLVIQWMNNVRTLDNLELINLRLISKSVSATFQDISFCHIFREKNSDADRLSKDAINLEDNMLSLEVLIDGKQSSHREHKLFTLRLLHVLFTGYGYLFFTHFEYFWTFM